MIHGGVQVGTEIWDDSGAPHTLEHLVSGFCGSWSSRADFGCESRFLWGVRSELFVFLLKDGEEKVTDGIEGVGFLIKVFWTFWGIE